MYFAIIALTVLVAALLMVVILMQQSKGGGLSATFGGGGGGDAMLGSRMAANVLHKATIYLVATFLGLCLIATIISGGGGGEVQSVTARALQEQSAASGFSTEIPTIPTPPAGTGEGEGE